MNNTSIPRAINATQMRQVNRSAIIELIRQNSPIARSDISRSLDLSLPTVVRIVEELIDDNLVKPTGETAGKTGRPRALLEFNKNGGAVIGIDLGGTKLYGALSSIGGDILGEVSINQHDSSGIEVFEHIAKMVKTLIELSNKNNIHLLGMGIGAPGVTNVENGVVEWAPSLNWRNFPIKRLLFDRFHLPVVVDNDVNLAVLGEQWFGAGIGISNLVLIAIGTGVGAGLILDGVLYRGHNESAGEVGYFLPCVQALGEVYDHFGAMESIISGNGIAQRAQGILKGSMDESQLISINASDVFESARNDQLWAKAIVDETINYLTMVIANISTLLDPQVIILSGGVLNSYDLLMEPIKLQLEGIIQHVPTLIVSKLGSKATAMGAISQILHLTKEYYIVRRLH